MFPNEKKNKMKLSVLSLLRANGMPGRPEEEDTDIAPEEKEMLLAENNEEELSPEEEKKKKKEENDKRRLPSILPSGAKSMRDTFRKSRF